MKRSISLVAMLICVCFLSGCGGDTQQSLAGEATTTLKDLVATLDTVKDEASANSAKDKLKSLFEKLKAINERQAKLPMPTEEQGKEMIAKYGPEMEELQKKMVGHMMRIGFDPKIRPILDSIDMKMK